jgi:hypothetical protein
MSGVSADCSPLCGNDLRFGATLEGVNAPPGLTATGRYTESCGARAMSRPCPACECARNERTNREKVRDCEGVGPYSRAETRLFAQLPTASRCLKIVFRKSFCLIRDAMSKCDTGQPRHGQPAKVMCRARVRQMKNGKTVLSALTIV